MKNAVPLVKHKGFTLIELLVVFSIIAIVSTVSLASFADFNKTTAVKQTGAQMVSFLNDAKSRSLAQVKPSSCTGSFGGYVVDICLSAGNGCSAADTYKMSVMCSGVKTALVPALVKKLPNGMHFSSDTSSTSYLFNVLTGGVTGPGDVVITGNNATITVTVTSVGSITYQ